jgi:hypothetical protein
MVYNEVFYSIAAKEWQGFSEVILILAQKKLRAGIFQKTPKSGDIADFARKMNWR